MTENIQVNDLVEYINPFDDEVNAIYRINEVNGNRVLMTCINTTMKIQPQAIARTNEIQVIK